MAKAAKKENKQAEPKKKREASAGKKSQRKASAGKKPQREVSAGRDPEPEASAEQEPEEKQTSGYYRDEFGRLAGLYDFGVKNAFRWIGGEIGFRCGIVEAADVRPGQSVLDVACGTGTLLALLAACTGPDGRAVGIDMSEEMLEKGRRKVQMSQVEFIKANAEDLPFEDESFDRVTSSLAIHEMNRAGRANALAEMHRVLKPGGLCVIADMRKPDTPFTRFGMRFVRLMETDTLTDMWSNGLARELVEAEFAIVKRHIAGRGFFEVLVAKK